MIGVDGCRLGWCGVALGGCGAVVAVARTFTGLLDELGASVPTSRSGPVLVDMPIGLPEGEAPRASDALARAALGPRRASIFPAPPRAVLRARDHAEANALARAATGRGLSVQSFNLLPRVAELDDLLARDPALAERVHESHPELCFARLGGAPCAHAKRTPRGRAERRALLERLAPGACDTIDAALARTRRADVAADDVADAYVLALVSRLAPRMQEHLPPDRPRDARGLRCSILAPRLGAALTDPT